MQTTFEELTVTLNKPYLYAHHGNCEHIITFTDIRGVSPDDERDEYVRLIMRVVPLAWFFHCLCRYCPT